MVVTDGYLGATKMNFESRQGALLQLPPSPAFKFCTLVSCCTCIMSRAHLRHDIHLYFSGTYSRVTLRHGYCIFLPEAERDQCETSGKIAKHGRPQNTQFRHCLLKDFT